MSNDNYSYFYIGGNENFFNVKIGSYGCELSYTMQTSNPSTKKNNYKKSTNRIKNSKIYE